MPLPIEDYAVLGDSQAAALVGKDGSIDWLCLPRFDSSACFAALLGSPEHGRWQIVPDEPIVKTERRYRPGTLVLETELTTRSGTIRVTDCMPPRGTAPDVVRQVEGLRGEVPVRSELVIRFDYGSIIPWVRNANGALLAVGGPDALTLRSTVCFKGEGLTSVAHFKVAKGNKVPFVLTWHPSHLPSPPPLEADEELRATEDWWRSWSDRCTYRGPYRDAVVQSLVALKALTYAPTGGIVAAATTSLPEWPGGARNWDYRYGWLRDASFVLDALMMTGYADEARAWRDWLLRSAAGDPAKLQIMYGVGGERRLPELELDWLPGYAGSRPVRVGNAAVDQQQLDVYGAVIDALFQARRVGLDGDPFSWVLQRKLLDHLDSVWAEADQGLWEVRGPPRHFTHSKVMAWVAFDRAVRQVELLGAEGPVDRWRAKRDQIHAEVCRSGFDPSRNAFMQSYGSEHLDASTLLMPIVGFLPASDPRIAGTVAAIERELLRDGLVWRYSAEKATEIDGVSGGEGAFLACSFWLADNYSLAGRLQEAKALFERLLALRNDVGLLSEEYDPVNGCQLGNFPQAFSHVGLVNSACNLTRQAAPPR